MRGRVIAPAIELNSITIGAMEMSHRADNRIMTVTQLSECIQSRQMICSIVNEPDNGNGLTPLACKGVAKLPTYPSLLKH